MSNKCKKGIALVSLIACSSLIAYQFINHLSKELDFLNDEDDFGDEDFDEYVENSNKRYIKLV